MGSGSVALKREIDAELVAVSLFYRAADRDVPLTRRWIESELDRLQAHSPTCLCNEPCQLAHNVTAAKVHFVARCWTLSTANTRRLARR